MTRNQMLRAGRFDAAIRAARARGVGWREISEALVVAYPTVQRRGLALGLGVNRPRLERKATVASLRAAGRTYAEIAATIGLSESRCWQIGQELRWARGETTDGV